MIPLLASVCLGLLGWSALWGEEPLRVSEAEGIKAAIEKTAPEYPPMAKQMRITGRVVVEAFVDLEGNVEKTQPVSGNAILSAAASRAVKMWKFKPFTVEGKPTKAIVRLAFTFNL